MLSVHKFLQFVKCTKHRLKMPISRHVSLNKTDDLLCNSSFFLFYIPSCRDVCKLSHKNRKLFWHSVIGFQSLGRLYCFSILWQTFLTHYFTLFPFWLCQRASLIAFSTFTALFPASTRHSSVLDIFTYVYRDQSSILMKFSWRKHSTMPLKIYVDCLRLFGQKG